MSTIYAGKNHGFVSAAKHIEICQHFIREMVNKEEIWLEFISINEEQANLFTKAISTVKYVQSKAV